MNTGLKISKDGMNVLTAPIHKLIYGSQFDTMKLFKYGSGEFTVTFPDAGTLTITHGLGYRPAFIFLSEVSPDFGARDEYFLMPFNYPVGGDTSIVPWVTSLVLSVRYGGAQAPDPISLKYKYYIFHNNITI